MSSLEIGKLFAASAGRTGVIRTVVNGSVHGSAIKFGAVGAGATYTGTVSGKSSMSGSYQALPKGGSWSATKSP